MRNFLVLIARIAVSLALLYLALRGINFAAIQERLSQINRSALIRRRPL